MTKRAFVTRLVLSSNATHHNALVSHCTTPQHTVILFNTLEGMMKCEFVTKLDLRSSCLGAEACCAFAQVHCIVLYCVVVCCSCFEVEACCAFAQMCCSMLQCVTGCCSILQCVAVFSSVLYCAAVHQQPFSVLYCAAVLQQPGDRCLLCFCTGTATHCNTLQNTATHCNTPHHIHTRMAAASIEADAYCKFA